VKLEFKQYNEKMELGDIAISNEGNPYLLIEVNSDMPLAFLCMGSFKEVSNFKVDEYIDLGYHIQGYEKIERIIKKENLKLVEL
jgi:hypothetical protein